MKKITLIVCAFVMGLAYQAQAQEVVLTQNVGEAFQNGGVSCPDGDNWWIRSFKLSDSGITENMTVTGAEFAVGSINFDDDFEVSVYDFPGFPGGFDITNPPAPIASAELIVGPADLMTKIRVDFATPVQVAPTSNLVVVVYTAGGTGNSIFLATTAAETKASYLASELCGILEPETVAAVGFPTAMHFINLVLDSALSVNDVLSQAVSVYPNPATSILNINLPSTIQVEKSSLVDMLGRKTGVVYSNGEMNVSGIAPGVYFLTLETNLGSYTQKIVKQ